MMRCGVRMEPQVERRQLRWRWPGQGGVGLLHAKGEALLREGAVWDSTHVQVQGVPHAGGRRQVGARIEARTTSHARWASSACAGCNQPGSRAARQTDCNPLTSASCT